MSIPPRHDAPRSGLFPYSRRQRVGRRQVENRPRLEFLEDRAVPSASAGTISFPGQFQPAGPDGALIYQANVSDTLETTVAPFVASGSGGLTRSIGASFGPDVNGDGVGELYVASFNSDQVLRYDGRTGTPYGAGANTASAVLVAAGSGGLDNPEYLAVRPDGYIYVVSSTTNQVFRYDANTGAFKDIFVKATRNGGLEHPLGLAFDGTGDLYVSGADSNTVVRFDRLTGAPKSTFVAAGSGGLSRPEALAFGPDGNLYVSSSGNAQVLRYNGTTGASLGAFVTSGSGGLSAPTGLAFGTDGKLYVSSVGNSALLRYNGTTGAFDGAYVPSGGGGLTRPTALLIRAEPFAGTAQAVYVTTADSSEVFRFDGSNGGPGDADSYTIDLEGGQGLALSLNAPLDFTVSLTDGSSNPVPLVDQDPGPGRLYQVIRIPQAGTYTLTVQAPNGLTAGSYSVSATLNALIDQSSVTAPIVQSLDATFVSLGVGASSSGGALGTIQKPVSRVLAEAEGTVNDLRGSWDAAGSGSWTVNGGSGVSGALNLKGAGNDASDSYRIDVRADDVLIIRTKGSSSGGGTLTKATLRLNGPDGSQVVAGTAVLGASSDSQIQFRVLTSGSYTIVVGTDKKLAGSYKLTVGLASPSDPGYRPDDVYTFAVDTPGALALSAATGTNPVVQPKVQLTLYGPDGQAVASAHRGTLDAFLRYDAPSAGVYTVVVSAAPGLTAASASYSLAVVRGGGLDTTANGTPSTAQDLSGESAVLGALSPTVAPFVASGSGGLTRSIGASFGPDINGDGVGELYVASFNSDQVLRYDGRTGTPYGADGNTASALLVAAGSGGLDNPEYLAVQPDGYIYVVSSTTNQVFRYDANTGAFKDIFVKAANNGGLNHPLGLAFKDGDLYVGGAGSNNVVRFDGTTGLPKSTFVAAGSGGLSRPEALAFGPDGNLYVSSSGTDEVLRYDGTTGGFLGAFVASGPGGLSAPTGLAFGGDGSLYVSSVGTRAVLRYDTMGAFAGAFVPSGAAGLSRPTALAFDAAGQLYVTTENQSSVLRVALGSDCYKLTVAEGQTRTVTVSLPGTDPGQFDNQLDLILEVVDAEGNPVADVTVVSLDGRKKQVALSAGTYFLRVRSGNPASGAYLVALS